MKYEHVFSLNFVLSSENEFPTKEEIFKRFQEAVTEVTEKNVKEYLEHCDTEIAEE